MTVTSVLDEASLCHSRFARLEPRAARITLLVRSSHRPRPNRLANGASFDSAHWPLMSSALSACLCMLLEVSPRHHRHTLSAHVCLQLRLRGESTKGRSINNLNGNKNQPSLFCLRFVNGGHLSGGASMSVRFQAESLLQGEFDTPC